MTSKFKICLILIKSFELLEQTIHAFLVGTVKRRLFERQLTADVQYYQISAAVSVPIDNV